MKTGAKRITAFILSLLMVFTMFGSDLMSISAEASTKISDIELKDVTVEYDGQPHSVEWKLPGNFKSFDYSSPYAGRWYSAKSDAEYWDQGYMGSLEQPSYTEPGTYDFEVYFDGYWKDNNKYKFINRNAEWFTATLTIKGAPQPKVFEVKFNAGPGANFEGTNPVKVNEGECVAEPQAPTRNGNEFLGWYLGDNKYDFTSPVKNNIELKAKWQEVVTVTYDLAGGNWNSEDKVTIKKDTILSKPSDPSRDGYDFLGWYKGDKKYNFNDKVKNDITLTAKWEKNSYAVAVYVTTGGKAGTGHEIDTFLSEQLGLPFIQEDGYQPAGVVTLPKNIFGNTSKANYLNNQNWSTVMSAVKNLDTSYLTGAAAQNAGNKVASLTDYIRFDANGGNYSHLTALFDWSYNTQNIALIDGKEYPYHLDLRFSKSKIDFKGMPTDTFREIDLKDAWYITGMTPIQPGDEILSDDQKTLYTIEGFYSDNRLTREFNFNAPLNNDTKVYVKLCRKPVTVTYLVDGNVFDTESVPFGGDALATKEPTKVGHEFKGWDKPEALKKVKNDVEVNALFDALSYDLTINYVFEDDTEAKAQYTDKIKYGEQFSVDSPTDIAGFTPDIATVAGIMTEKGYTAKVTYVANAHNLTINYRGLPENLEELAPDYKEVYKYGSEYKVTSPSVEGYTANPKEISGTMPDEDVTEDVVYTINSHDVIIHYEYEDVAGNAFDDYKVSHAFGTKVEVTSPAAPQGYYLDEEDMVFELDSMPDEKVEVTITYKLASYELSIEYFVEAHINGATAETPASVNEMIKYKSAYEYVSPSLEHYSVDIPVVEGKMPAEKVSVEVHYSLNSYKVVYHFEDGTEFYSAEYKAFSKIPAIEGPAKAKTVSTEYAFAYWITKGHDDIPVLRALAADSGLNKVEFPYTVLGRVDFYPVYEESARSYTVTFVDHDGTVLSKSRVEYGNAAKAPKNPTRDSIYNGDGTWYEFTFTGWNKNFSNIKKDLTVTAVYSSELKGTVIPPDEEPEENDEQPVGPQPGPGNENNTPETVPEIEVEPEVIVEPEPEVQEVVIAPSPVPQAVEVEIPEADVPLALEDHCYMHWIVLLITLIYGGYAATRSLTMKKEEEEAKEALN